MRGQRKRHALFTIVSFRFDEENVYEYEIQLQVFFAYYQKTDTPESLIVLLIHQKS